MFVVRFRAHRRETKPQLKKKVGRKQSFSSASHKARRARCPLPLPCFTRVASPGTPSGFLVFAAKELAIRTFATFSSLNKALDLKRG
ncbi:Protein of unknown function [Pyronema omphalodes CBS 100304]|uniref:Uncharacterized protein n=1 Tax=Pyronema omphalodes (strain CBS 100304) TaxID=1076935 RepID=U4L400_PYROM|nr:Protein of unknown function [Pyronema omphalodes CBS 100304]